MSSSVNLQESSSNLKLISFILDVLIYASWVYFTSKAIQFTC